MILARLAVKVYLRREDQKINSMKKLPPVGIEPGTIGLLLWYNHILVLSCHVGATTGRVQIGIRTRYHQTNVDDSMTITRILIGKMALMSSFYFSFNINVLTDIW